MFDLERFRSIVAGAEFHKFLALELLEGDAHSGRVLLKLAYDPKYSIFPEPGTYHGGILASLVDVAGALACGMKVGRPTPTANLRIDFLDAPAKIDLYASGQLRRFGRNLAVADVEIRDAAGTVYCIGRGSFSTAGAFKAIAQGAPSAREG
ncbi:MAG: phenylacetic acid degradation protein [Betaproteobacteria bacterium RIFCSPLOWO2_12_FULL_65_14]|nr:MAG: phenylacetic acid degradation protein [Betaproteobacteria bacterium RIFCSPLOWO2_12_FULL_65_14]